MTAFENNKPNGDATSLKTVGLLEISSVTTGSSNTINALDEGPYPFFDRSQVVKRSNK